MPYVCEAFYIALINKLNKKVYLQCVGVENEMNMVTKSLSCYEVLT